MTSMVVFAVVVIAAALAAFLLVAVPGIVRAHRREQQAIERAMIVQSANRQIRALNQVTLQTMYMVTSQSIGVQR